MSRRPRRRQRLRQLGSPSRVRPEGDFLFSWSGFRLHDGPPTYYRLAHPRKNDPLHLGASWVVTCTRRVGLGHTRNARNAAYGAKRAAVSENKAVGSPRIDDNDPPRG